MVPINLYSCGVIALLVDTCASIFNYICIDQQMSIGAIKERQVRKDNLK